ncbi:MAG: hypothetical protein V2A78_03635 [bacterium]
MKKESTPSGLWFVVMGACSILIGLVAFALFYVGPFAEKKAEKTPVPQPAASLAPLPTDAPAGADKLPIQNEYKDLVCGRIFNADSAAASSVYLGRTFYFDCLECKKAFDANPLKYIPIKIKVKINPGETLDESPGPVTTIKPSVPQQQDDYWEDTTPAPLPSPQGGEENSSPENSQNEQGEPQSTP